MILRFTIPGKPQPKQRARRDRGGWWYTPKATRAYESLVGWCATGARPHAAWPLDATYRVTCELYMPDRRTRDGDNVLKSIQDGASGVLWNDDRQVVETTVRKALDRDNPRVEVTVEVLP